jgi:hypothetical protein
MTTTKSNVATHTNWDDLSPAAKALIRMCAASPVWRFTSFAEPPADCLEALLAAAWNRSRLGEPELRGNPEAVVAALKKLVTEQLQAN